ncbi:hypothetical protein MKX03_010998 [Papaver bracteatum]|nr:hypothetical protein MKX03_010998 [Papaver bracteatum]
MVLKGHKNVVLDLQRTTDGYQIISASPDKTLRPWNVGTGKQINRIVEHSSFVNSCCPSRRGPPLVVSGSDDGTAKLWDLRQKGSIQTFPDKYQITAVGFGFQMQQIRYSLVGLINDVKVWDLCRNELCPDGSYLLTNAMDCSLRIWDLRPYAPQNGCVKIFTGHQHNFGKTSLKCSWSIEWFIWDMTSRRVLYMLPGHNGSVNVCVFHLTEPIIGSCSYDKQIYLGEI